MSPSLKAGPSCRYSWALWKHRPSVWSFSFLRPQHNCGAARRQREKFPGAGGLSALQTQLSCRGQALQPPKQYFKSINMTPVQSWITAAELKGRRWLHGLVCLLTQASTEGTAEGLWSKTPQCTEQEKLSFRQSLHYSVYEELLLIARNKSL